MDRFQSTLDAWRVQAAVPIVTAAVRLNGSMVWNGVSLDESVENTGHLSSRSRFPIYSITKTFTAVCMLRLDAAGLLDLDDPIDRWFDDMPVPSAVRLSHLLRHTSGIPDYGPLPHYHQAVKDGPSTPWTDAQFLAATLAKGILFEPGSGWSYSNVGYLLLRRVIERATGLSFRQQIDQDIVRRLGLSDTFIAETIDDWASCVPGYGREVRSDPEVVDIRATYHPGWCAPGVAVSTVDDVTRFYDGLFAGELLDPERLERMLVPVRVPGSDPHDETPSCCGMGILADPHGPFGPSYGHGGGGPGYRLSASILPRSTPGRLSVAVFCNSSLGADARSCEHAVLQVATEAA